MYIDQCHVGSNTVKVSATTLASIGKAQDHDGTDEIMLQLDSGFCGHGLASTSALVEIPGQATVDLNDLGGFVRHAFYDYPVEVRLAESDILSPDAAKPLTISSDQIRNIYTILDTGNISSVVFRHLFKVSESVLSGLQGWSSEEACIDMLQFASGKAATAVTVVETTHQAATALSKGGNEQAKDVAEALDSLLEAFSVCDTEAKEFMQMNLGIDLGGDAAYVVTVKVEMANKVEIANSCHRLRLYNALIILMTYLSIISSQ